MRQLLKNYPVEVWFFASEKYWKNSEKLHEICGNIANNLKNHKNLVDFQFSIKIVDSEAKLKTIDLTQSENLKIFVPLSGAVQNWMIKVSQDTANLAIFNAYLSESGLNENICKSLLSRNTHPSCTDFYAYARKQGKNIFWLSRFSQVADICISWQALQRLQNAVFVQIGETEPWVINSCRNKLSYEQKLGCKIVSVSQSDLNEKIKEINKNEVKKIADNWINQSNNHNTIKHLEVEKACNIYLGMKMLLEDHQADGLAIACFALINKFQTTSCLALSTINDTPEYVAACEGDLEAMVSMFLMKALGANYVWMGNPVIHDSNYLDLVHCTAALKVNGQKCAYNLQCHHESGIGVSPEISLPPYRKVTLCRIGNDLQGIVICPGNTIRAGGLETCRTQQKNYHTLK